MGNFDVIIVGAGPAGLGAANVLAGREASVLCIDRKAEIGLPVRCAEGLGTGWFERTGIKPDRKWISADIHGAAFYSPNGRKLEVRSDAVVGHILDRKIFEKELAKQAEQSGATIKLRTDAIAFERKAGSAQGGKVIVTVDENGKQKQYSASIVIAADGVESVVARKLGLNTTNRLQDIDSGFQYRMAGIEYGEQDLIHLYFGTEIAPRGYAWIFPKGKDVANVGIGITGTEQKTAKACLDSFVAQHPGIAKGKMLETNVGAVPVGGFLDTMVADNLLVCGDAAHQVNPIHGGGIGIAIEAAQIAAGVAAEALAAGDTSAKFLSRYNGRWYSARGNKLKQVLKRRHMLEAMSDSDFEAIAGSMTGDDVLKIAEGDLAQSAKVIATKLIKKPALVKVMLKYLR